MAENGDVNAPPTPSTDLRKMPPLGVEVRVAWKRLRRHLVLESNWFAVDKLRITIDRGTVTLRRRGHATLTGNGAGALFVGEQMLQASRPSRWRGFTSLPIEEGRIVEFAYGKGGVHCALRVMRDDVRLDVIDLSIGRLMRRGCRVELVSGLIDTEVALRCLVYFWAELETDRLSTT